MRVNPLYHLIGAVAKWPRRLLNRGIFMTPGDEEQWTLSVQHTDGDIDRYVEVFAGFCQELARG